MDERRSLPRWEIKKEATVWFSETKDLGFCTVEDMHLKGMRISSNRLLPPQEPLKIMFAIGDSLDFIKVEAEVPWQGEEQGRYFYGLSFSRVDDADKNKISEYINTNCYDQIKKHWWE